jgi:hypothetical protein
VPEAITRLTPIPVASLDEEVLQLGCCSCKRKWRLACEDVIPLSGHWYDALILTCPSCGLVKRAIFDITPFFDPRGRAWTRY